MIVKANESVQGVVTYENKPVWGCHVYINEMYGTVTDTGGYFHLDIPAEYLHETLTISHTGFKSLSIQPMDFKDEAKDFILEEEILSLDEVLVVIGEDPWQDFRDSVDNLSAYYESKTDLLIDMVKEFDEMNIVEQRIEEKKAVAPNFFWSQFLLVILLTIGVAIMIKSYFPSSKTN